MSTQSTNLGLDKRGANDNFSNTKLNENWDKLDTEIGSDTGGGLKKRTKDTETELGIGSANPTVSEKVTTIQEEIGDTSTPGTIQYNILALQGSICPSGAVMSFARNSAPTGWLKCSGQAISRITYAALFSAIGTTGSGFRSYIATNVDNDTSVSSGSGLYMNSCSASTNTHGEGTVRPRNIALLYCIKI